MESVFDRRAKEKALSRANDDARLFSGEVSREELRNENALSALFDMSKARIENWV